MRKSFEGFGLADAGGPGGVQFTAKGMATRLRQGEPKIPFVTAYILLPFGKRADKIEVVKSGKTTLQGAFFEPGPKVMPFSLPTDKEPMLPEPEIYGSDAPYPGHDFEFLSTQEVCGYKVAVINLFPVQYHPRSGTADCCSSLDVNLTLSDSDGASPGLRALPEDIARVSVLVDNPEPEILATYDAPGGALLAAGCQTCGGSADYKYVIITKQQFASAFQALVTQKTTRQDHPITATIKTTESILSDARFYTNSACMTALGYTDSPVYNDEPARIRNFIRYAYKCWATQFVLLGGDADRCPGGSACQTPCECLDYIVPVRKLEPSVVSDPQSGPCQGNPVVSDTYYACLTGSFNQDGDARFGEHEDDPDLTHEVYVGRAPVDTNSPEKPEIANFCGKIAAYENAAQPSASILMVGDRLGDGIHHFGYMMNFGDFLLDEIRHGSSEYGALSAGYPPVFAIQTLYSRDYYPAAWSKDDLLELVNSNSFHALENMGHAATLKNLGLCHSHYEEPHLEAQYCGQNPIDDVEDMPAQKVSFIFSDGCFPNAFDNFWDMLSGGEGFTRTDCIAEALLLDHPDRGAWSYIGNTRFGVGEEDSTDCPAGRFHRAFIDGLFHASLVEQHPLNLGWALAWGKDKLRNQVDGEYMLYTYYELSLTGDPETRFRVPSPEMPVADLYLTRSTFFANASIVGTASRGFADSATFSFFSIYYRPKTTPPSSWSSVGITKTGNGATPVLDDPRVLGTWNLAQIPQGLPKAGTYEVQLLVCDSQYRSTTDTVEYHVNRYVTDSGVASAGGLVDSSPALVNLDANPDLEIVVGSYNGRVYAFKSNMTPLWISDPLGGLPGDASSISASPAVGDIDNDGQLEVVIATLNNSTLDLKHCYVLRGSNGTVKWKYPFSWNAACYASPVLCDLNADGFLEILQVVGDDNSLSGMHCINRLGQELWFYPTHPDMSSLQSSPAVGDVDGDGRDEVVFACAPSGTTINRVVALRYTGQAAWVFDLAPEEPIRSSIALGDLDGDKALDLVFATRLGRAVALRGTNGEAKWTSQVVTGVRLDSVSLGDVDGDQCLEVLVGGQDNGLRILNPADGAVRTTIWGDPKVLDNDNYDRLCSVTAPSLVDLNADGRPEIIFGSTDHLVRAVTYSQGNFSELWSFNFGNSVYSSAAIGDTDRDGKVDIVAGTRGSNVRRIDTEHSWSPASARWPMFRHDARRTGCTPVKRGFIRGDANRSGTVTPQDSYFITSYLGGSGQMPGCMDAADANDDGVVSSQDATYIMSWYYSGGPAPPAPFPGCGLDPTEDALTCYGFPPCP